MNKAYCIKCRRVRQSDETMWVFKTGFVRVGNLDLPLGICGHHESADDHKSSHGSQTTEMDAASPAE